MNRRLVVCFILLPFSGLLGIALIITQPLFSSVIIPRSSLGAVEKTNLEGVVRKLTESAPPRDFSHPKQLAEIGSYLEVMLQSYGLKTSRQKFSVNGNEFFNVSTVIGDPFSTRLVVGAHYDVAGPFPGADDNASGIAALLEIARIFSRNPPARTIELVAYTLEEPPIFPSAKMGSFIHAQSLRTNHVEVSCMISLEMLGFYSDLEGSQHFPFPGLGLVYSNVGNSAVVVGSFDDIGCLRALKRGLRNADTLPIVSFTAPKFVSEIAFSDHRNYWSNGYSAVMLTDTAFLRNRNYHSEKDTIESLDFNKLVSVTQAIIAAIQTEF